MIFIDFETRSHALLGQVGGRGYVRDDTTEVMVYTAIDTRFDPAVVYCVSPFVGSVPIRGWEVEVEDLNKLGFPADALVYTPPIYDIDESHPLWQAAIDGVPFVAHNADNFDSHVWEGLGYPPAQWIDTMHLVARRGLPRKLELIGQTLFGIGKDPLGVKIMRLCSEPQKKGPLKGRFVEPDAARLSRLARYCLRDTLILAAVWYEEMLGKPNADDPVLRCHRRINDRGVFVDIDAALRLRQEEQAQQEEAVHRAVQQAKIDPSIVTSPIKLQRWLEARKIPAPDATRATMEDILARPDLTDEVRLVIEARLACSRITSSKIEAILHRVCPDRRLRDMYVYYGAHTGRWSARGVQTQNLAAPKVKVTEDIYDHPDQAPMVAVEEEITVADVFGSMLRGLFMAPPGKVLAIVDWSGVEARGLLWCANDKEGLAQIAKDDEDKRAGRKSSDPYKRLASRIFSVPVEQVTSIQRQAGKVGVLACGYQGGPNALLAMANKMKIDLAAAGVTAEQIVESYRDANPLIAGVRKGTWTTPEGKVIVTRTGGLWRDTREVVADIARGFTKEGDACRCHWWLDGKHLICTLPSGRELVYRELRWENVANKWGGEGPSITYLSARGIRTPTYGGKLVENVVQAVCRDFMSTAMVAIEEELGIPIVMHTHDELVMELDEDRAQEQYALVLRAILTLPSWADGFPSAVEGVVSRRYCKP